MHRIVALFVAVSFGLVGCASAEGPTLTEPSSTDETTEDTEDTDTSAEDSEAEDGAEDAANKPFPDVIEVNFARQGQGPYSFDVTVSSPYDTPERYADAWRVVGLDGTVYGLRELTHDHQGEQPFTRSLEGVEIPEDVTELLVEARDSENGWGGGTVEIRLDPAT